MIQDYSSVFKMVEFEVPNYKISVFGLDADRTAIATGRNMRISPKHAREICHELKGKYLETAPISALLLLP